MINKYWEKIKKLCNVECNFYRYQNTYNPITKESIQVSYLLYENKLCYYENNVGNINQKEGSNILNTDSFLVFEKEIQLKEGDKVVIKKDCNELYEFTTYNVNCFISHSECSLKLITEV
ncbi:MAG: hypothetical protein ACRCZ0_09835 [Cetobacterium sp.]